jgi:hypothetical protein
MDTSPASDHLTAEIAASVGSGRPLGTMRSTRDTLALGVEDMEGEERRRFLRAMTDGAKLPAAAPVPGCGCEDCNDIPAALPSRVPAWQRNRKGRDGEPWEAKVERARSVAILDVAALLGLGEPVKRGRELHVSCPLHSDTRPSCRISASAGIWFCDPCGVGGDAIDLYMRARRLTFADAVRELVA